MQKFGWIVFLILAVISIAWVSWYYFKRYVPKLKQEIDDTSTELFWPESWKRLAYIPFWGRIWFNRIKQASTQPISLALPNRRSGGLQKSLECFCEWYLFQDLYELASGEQSGSFTYPLSDNVYFICVKEQTSVPEISLIPPNKITREKKLGLLKRDGLRWELTNLQEDHSLIPVFSQNKERIDSDDLEKSLAYGDSALISSRNLFVVAGVEFQIMKLPSLELFQVKKRKKSISLSDNLIRIDSNNNILKDGCDGDIHIEIHKLSLHAIKNANIISGLKDITEICADEFIPLVAGDKFWIDKPDEEFFVGYKHK